MSYIELIGCTGAGKTTLLRNILQVCREQGLDAFDGDEYVLENAHLNWVKGYVARTLFIDILSLTASIWAWRKHSDFYQLVFRIILSLERVDCLEKLNIIRNTLKKIGVYEIIGHLNSDQQIIILDEGSLHTAHYLFVHLSTELPDMDLLSFVKSVPLPDIVIYLRQDEETLIKRTLIRGHKRIPTGSREMTERFIRRAVITLNKLTQNPNVASRLFIVEPDYKVHVPQNEKHLASKSIILEILKAGLELNTDFRHKQTETRLLGLGKS
jgi:thymidylate kinase